MLTRQYDIIYKVVVRPCLKMGGVAIKFTFLYILKNKDKNTEQNSCTTL